MWLPGELLFLHDGFDFLFPSIGTVKLLYNTHLRDQQYVVLIHRCSFIYAGSTTWKLYPWWPAKCGLYKHVTLHAGGLWSRCDYSFSVPISVKSGRNNRQRMLKTDHRSCWWVSSGLNLLIFPQSYLTPYSSTCPQWRIMNLLIA